MNKQPQQQAEYASKKRKNPFLDLTISKRLKTDADSKVQNDSLAFIDEEMEENIVNYFPNEILIQIFKNLRPVDITSIAIVCRSWRDCSKDDSLGWYPLFRTVLVESTRYYRYSKLKAPGQYKTLEEARKANELDLEQFDGVLKYLGYEPALHGYFHYYLIKCNSQIRLVHHQTKLMTSDWHSNCYRYTVSCDERVTSCVEFLNSELSINLDTEVNLRRVEKRVRNGEEIGMQQELLRKAVKRFRAKELKTDYAALQKDSLWNAAMLFKQKNTSHQTYLKQPYDPLLSYTPQVNSIVTAKHERMIGVELHDYQLRAINFMVSVEQERKRHKVSPLMSIPMTYLLANPLIKKNCLVLPKDAKKHDMIFTVKGGVLADEMGLGKSIEVLGLILERPMVQKPNEDKLFVTKATLIFCPNHLVQQWQNEIEKHTEPKLSVIAITTINHVKKYTPQDLMNADVVIATYNLLQNANYLKFPHDGQDDDANKLDIQNARYKPFDILQEENRKKKAERVKGVILSERYKRINALLEENRKKKNAEKVKGVILEHYLWHRIVLDEGHEVVKEKWFKMMHKIRATHKWLVSGTPFPQDDSMYRVRLWLGMAIPRKEDSQREYNAISSRGINYNATYDLPSNLVHAEHGFAKILIKELLWRNTKKSVRKEYEMVKVDEEIKKIVLSPLEKAIYKHFSYPNNAEELLSCCYTMNSAWGKTNEERRQYFITSRREFIEQATDELAKLNREHEVFAKKLAECLHVKRLRKANDFMMAYPSRLSSLSNQLDQHKRILKVFKRLEFDEDNEEGQTTKLKELVSYLKDLFERDNKSRVIIFSQYHNFLEQIGRVLTENDILTTNLKGNVYQKTRGLNKFKTDISEVKVMLMSFNNTASGTNLIEANHVIFMDPLNKSDTEVKAIESQAIGRAQRQGQTQRVKLVRFLVDDSIETTIHSRNHARDRFRKI